MAPYLLRRVVGLVVRILLLSLLLFLLVQLPPGGPADVYAADPAASPDVVARLEALWGLDRPLHEQYLRWLGNAVRGDWGSSFSLRRPVRVVVLERLGNTLWLMTGALAVGLVAGVTLGTLAALARRRSAASFVQLFAVLGMSVPTFWSGALVILVFGVYLDWIPTGGIGTVGAPFSLLDRLWHLVAPACVLGSVYVAQWSRYVHAGLAEVLAEDFVTVARAKGLGAAAVLRRHAAPNAALPFITLLALEAPTVVAGAIVTEVVFSWPGIGRLLTQGLLSRDYPVVMAILMVIVLMVVVANLVADLVYALVDPRVRYA